MEKMGHHQALFALSFSLSSWLAVTPGGSYDPQGHSWSVVPRATQNFFLQ